MVCDGKLGGTSPGQGCRAKHSQWLGAKDAGRHIEPFAERSGSLFPAECCIALKTNPFAMAKARNTKLHQQVGMGLEQPVLVEGVPAHRMAAGKG